MLLTTDLKKSVLCWILSISMVLLFTLPMYFFTSWSLSDIFLIPGVLYLGYLALRWIVRTGVFDVFAYQFSNWFSSWKKGIPKKYQDAYEFKEEVKEKRKDHRMVFLPWLVVGGVCLILCIVFSFYPGLGR